MAPGRSWLPGGRTRSAGGSFKYHFSVQIDEVVLRDGVAVPPGSAFRVAWKRGEKLASTRIVSAEGSRINFDETLSLVCTMYRDQSVGGFAPKDASFTLLQLSREGRSNHTKKLAKASIDLAQFADVEQVVRGSSMVLLHDGVPLGDIKLTISSRWLKNYARVAGEESIVSDSGSDRSDLCSDYGYSEASTGSLSVASGSGSCGSDIGKVSELDTDDELEERTADRAVPRASALRQAAAPGGQPAVAPVDDSKGASSALSRGLALLPSRPGKAAKQEALASRAALEVTEEKLRALESQLEMVQAAGRRTAVEAQHAEDKLKEMVALLEGELAQVKEELGMRASQAEDRAAALAQQLDAEKTAGHKASAAAAAAAAAAAERWGKAEAEAAAQKRELERRAGVAEGRAAALEAELFSEREARRVATAEMRDRAAAELSACRADAARESEALAAELCAARVGAAEAAAAAAAALEAEREAGRRGRKEAEAGAQALATTAAGAQAAVLAAAQADAAAKAVRLKAAEAELAESRSEAERRAVEAARAGAARTGGMASDAVSPSTSTTPPHAVQRVEQLEAELAAVRADAQRRLAASKDEAEAARGAGQVAMAALAAQVEAGQSQIDSLAGELERVRAEVAEARAEAAALKQQAGESLRAAAATATARDGGARWRDELVAAGETRRQLEEQVASLQQQLREERRAAREAAAAAGASFMAEADAAAADAAAAAAREAAEAARRGDAAWETARAGWAAERAALEERLANVGKVQDGAQASAAAERELAAARSALAQAREAGRDAITLVCRHMMRAEMSAEASLQALHQRVALAAASQDDGATRRSAGKGGVSTHAAALFSEGKAANAAGDHWRASQLFEHAYVAQPRLAFLLSAANMYLKLHLPEHAAAAYRHVCDHPDASANETEMARRKLDETDAARRAVEDRLSALLQAPVSIADAAAELAAADGSDDDDDDDDDPFASDALALERRLCRRLSMLVATGAAAGEAAPASQLERQLERLQADLRKATLAKAQAVADKTAVERELAQQHKMHRRARASQLALQEVATALEVKLAAQSTHAPAELRSGDEMTRVVLQEQAGQIVELLQRNAELEAEIALHVGARDAGGTE